jgi:hypothetical protein
MLPVAAGAVGIAERPSQAALESNCVLSFYHALGEVIESREGIRRRGDAQTICLQALLRVRRNGGDEFAKERSRSYPRRFI